MANETYYETRDQKWLMKVSPSEIHYLTIQKQILGTMSAVSAAFFMLKTDWSKWYLGFQRGQT